MSDHDKPVRAIYDVSTDPVPRLEPRPAEAVTVRDRACQCLCHLAHPTAHCRRCATLSTMLGDALAHIQRAHDLLLHAECGSLAILAEALARDCETAKRNADACAAAQKEQPTLASPPGVG